MVYRNVCFISNNRPKAYFTATSIAVVTYKAMHNIARDISENRVVGGAGSIQSNLSSGILRQ